MRGVIRSCYRYICHMCIQNKNDFNPSEMKGWKMTTITIATATPGFDLSIRGKATLV